MSESLVEEFGHGVLAGRQADVQPSQKGWPRRAQIQLFFEGKVGERKPSRSPSNLDDVALVKAYRKDLEATEGVVAEARTQALADREAAVKPQSIRDYKLVLKPGSEVTTTLVKDQPFCILM